MDKNNSGISCLIAFIGLGLFLLFYNRIMIFSPVFIMMIVGVVVLCIMISALCSKDSNEAKNQYRKEIPNTVYQNTLRNPYITKRVEESKPKIVEKKEIVKEPPNITRYCPFCGVLRERDAIYCYNCGTRLDND